MDGLEHLLDPLSAISVSSFGDRVGQMRRDPRIGLGIGVDLLDLSGRCPRGNSDTIVDSLSRTSWTADSMSRLEREQDDDAR